jgi:hypothetical protein
MRPAIKAAGREVKKNEALYREALWREWGIQIRVSEDREEKNKTLLQTNHTPLEKRP